MLIQSCLLSNIKERQFVVIPDLGGHKPMGMLDLEIDVWLFIIRIDGDFPSPHPPPETVNQFINVRDYLPRKFHTRANPTSYLCSVDFNQVGWTQCLCCWGK